MKNQIKEYNSLRVLLTILVITGHSTYLNISTQFGGIYYQDYLRQAGFSLSIIYRLAMYVNQFIYTFHMELFMMLSGALFLYEINKYTSRMLINKKIKRILLPYILCLCLIVLPIKYFTGYWSNSVNLIKDILIGQFLLQGNNHLWFLPVLFIISLLILLIEKRNKCLPLIMFIFIVLYLISGFIPVRIISYIFKYLVWFYLGLLFEKYRESINNKLNIKHAFILILSGGILFIVYKLSPLYLNIFIKPIITCCMSLFTYIIALYLSKKIQDNNIILKDSYDLYLFSDPINYIYIYLLFSFIPLSVFENNIYSLLIIIVRFLVQLDLGLLIAETIKITKKNKI